MVTPLSPTTHAAAFEPTSAPQRTLQQGNSDTLSSAAKSPGCLKSIWDNILGFVEASFNLIKFFICCACKSPFTKPFELDEQREKCSQIYSAALERVTNPNEAQSNSKQAGTQPLVFLQQICQTFEESRKIDPEVTQYAQFSVTINNLSLSVSLHDVEEEKLLAAVAESIAKQFGSVTNEYPSVEFHVEYLRLSGNRIETHGKTHTPQIGGFSESSHSSSALAFTRKGALENFTHEYNRIRGMAALPEELFDSRGKLMLMS